MIKIKNLQEETVRVVVYNHVLPHEGHRLAATEFISLKKDEYKYVTDHQAKFFMSDVVSPVNGVDFNIGRAIDTANFAVTPVVGHQNKVERFVVTIPKGSLADADVVLKHNVLDTFVPAIMTETANVAASPVTSSGVTTFKVNAAGALAATSTDVSFIVDVLYYSL